MLLCVLVVVLLGIVYMGLEYGKEEAVLRVSGSEGTAGAVTVEGEEAPGNVKVTRFVFLASPPPFITALSPHPCSHTASACNDHRPHPQ